MDSYVNLLLYDMLSVVLSRVQSQTCNNKIVCNHKIFPYKSFFDGVTVSVETFNLKFRIFYFHSLPDIKKEAYICFFFEIDSVLFSEIDIVLFLTSTQTLIYQ